MKKVLIAIFIVAVAAGAYIYVSSLPDPTIEEMPIVNATIQEKTFKLYAPDTPEGLQKGLAVFDEIAQNEGMIFRGLPVGVQSFWMKDMKFDIDIIWVNKDNEVIHVVYDASKDSYPARFENPREKPASYVIELNAGLVEKYNIQPGSKVTIQ